jgi:hypothetical protein
MANRSTRPLRGTATEVEGFSNLIKSQVQIRLVQAQELAQDARLIASAWEQRDVSSLVALNVLDSDQAVALQRLWDSEGGFV